MLAHGSWSHVSCSLQRKLVEAEALTNPPHSTGSLSLVRTVLNYQNVTNDPTCETRFQQIRQETLYLHTSFRAERAELVLAHMGSLVRGCSGLHTHPSTLVQMAAPGVHSIDNPQSGRTEYEEQPQLAPPEEILARIGQ